MFEGGDPAFPVWLGTFGVAAANQTTLLLKELDSSVSLTTAAPYMSISTLPNGAKEIDTAATLVLMANKLANLEARVAAIEGMP
jgi:hypothetical protein